MTDGERTSAGATAVAALSRQAADRQQAGDLDAAARAYEEILRIDGNHIDALTNLGALELQRGNFTDAVRLLDASLSRKPDQFFALNCIGCALQELGDIDSAVKCFQRSVSLRPDFADAHYNCGNALYAQGRRDEALAAYDRALSVAPDYADAVLNRGIVLAELARFDEALASFDSLAVRYPDHPVSHFNRGAALSELGRYEEALAAYDRYLALAEDDAEIHNRRGNMQRALGRGLDALASYDAALQFDDGIVELHLNRAGVLLDLHFAKDSLESVDAALSLDPGNEDAHAIRGRALLSLRRHREAIAAFETVEGHIDRQNFLAGSLLHARQQICDWSNGDGDLEAVLKGLDAGRAAAVPYVMLSAGTTPEQQKRFSDAYNRQLFPHLLGNGWQAPAYDHDRIRVGYFSADFRVHPVACLIAGMFESHDRSAFEITAFSFGPPDEDEMRTRIALAFDEFVECSDSGDDEIAALAREKEIDIAVDLNGFTAGARTHLFAERVAPVQVNYLGYPGTMGSGYMDYLMADAVLIPDEHRSAYGERIVYLPDSYQPNDRRRAIANRQFGRAELGLPEDGFVFCCFNNNFKIGPFVFDIWMRILAGVPGSVLWLVASNEDAAASLKREAESRGVSADRLVFASRMPLSDHLARMRQADLSLDTPFYNGHTTTSDALWAGVPVITCPGETFAGRVAASILTAAGMTDLIAPDWAAYEALALDLARNPDRLTAIRGRLAAERERCALFDTERQTRHVEEAYRRMIGRHRDGLPPEDMRIDGG